MLWFPRFAETFAVYLFEWNDRPSSQIEPKCAQMFSNDESLFNLNQLFEQVDKPTKTKTQLSPFVINFYVFK